LNRLNLKAHDGRTLVGYRFDPPHGVSHKGGVVIAPAMATPQSYYAPFAACLAAQGYAVWTFDYRDTGESLQGGMRGTNADIGDWITRDYDAVVRLAADATPGMPLFAVGHSLGGQCAPLLPSRTRLAGLVNIAVGSGSLRHNTPQLRPKAWFMWHLMAPALCAVFGYFPGARIGVVGDIPSGAMRQWRRWCLTPDYLLTGEPGAREAYASAAFPVLGLTFADDEMLLAAGSKMLHEAYRKITPDYRVIKAADVGMARIGHFGFFRPQSETTLWPLVTDWLAARVAATHTN
jgi:predicted alpha/beta hydrolase